MPAFRWRSRRTPDEDAVFLIDDHSVLRQGLRLLIDGQPDMHVVGEAERGRGAAEAINRAGGADAILLDVSLPDSTGPQVATDLREAIPDAKIIVLTRHAEKAYVQRMMQNGARGYVLKQTAAEVLLTAIRTVASGGMFLDPAIAAI